MVNPYEMAIRVTGENNFSSMMTLLTGGLLGANAEVKKLQEGFAKLKMGILGAVGALSGVALLDGLKSIADHGDKLLDQQNKMIRLGIQQNDVLRATNDFYQNIAKAVPTATGADYLQTVRELYGVVGELKEAEKFAQKALRVDAVLENTLGTKAKGSGTEFYKFMRSGEMAGIGTSPEKLEKFTDEVFSYVQAFGGKLTPADFVTLARRGMTAWSNAVDLDRALGAFAVTAADLGGSTAGTSLNTLQQLQMGSATMTKQQIDVFKQAGLIDMSKVKQTGFGGGHMQLEPGALKGAIETMGDLPKWIEEYIRPALEKLAGGDHGLYEALLGKVMPNRNAAYMAEMFGDPNFLRQREKDLGIARNSKGELEAYKSFTTEDPMGVKMAFNKQYESMMQAIGAPLMQAAIPVMKAVTDMFTKLGAWANANPTTVVKVGEAIAGIGVSLIGLGTVGVLSAFLPGGIVTVALGTLAAVLGVLSQIDYKSLNQLSGGWGDKISEFMSANWNKAISDWFASVNWAGYWEPVASTFKLFWEGFADDALKPLLALDWKGLGSVAWGVVTDGMAKVIDFFGKLGAAIGDFFNKIGGWFQKTNFEGGGFGGAQFQNVAFHPGGSGGATNGLGGITSLGGPSVAGRAAGGVTGGAGIAAADPSVYGAIMRAEGASRTDPYNTVLGNGAYGLPTKPLTDMTLAEAYAFGRTVLHRHGSSSAIGAFQIVGTTMKAAMARLGMGWSEKFSPENQRKMADWIIHNQGLSAWEGFKSHRGELAAARYALAHPQTPQDYPIHHALRSMFGHPHRGHGDGVPSLGIPAGAGIPKAGTGYRALNIEPEGVHVPPPPRRSNGERQSHVYLDGRIVGQMIERHIVRGHRFAHSTADHDGRAGVPAVDGASVG